MTNLFSTFDPSTNILNLSINWLSTVMSIIILPCIYWINNSRLTFMWNKMSMKIYKEINTLIDFNKVKGSIIMLMSLMFMLMINNSMGLFPYIFTSTSHIVYTMTMALPIWVMTMLYGWINKTNHMFAHMVPQGTPIMLMSFMVIIETVSNMIRPGTLAIRLAANMISGHLLLTLVGNMGSNYSTKLMMIIMSMQLLLIILESAVSMIQAYVFTMLSTLYISETK
uniref:ATP synthase subunit a n=1 Tax=Chorotypus fenestratus TaxID=1564101 RepID=A0A0N7AXT7_9ORTH|nr:ATP synthase F0 subunit 6 [Chorotypus fenestratus]